MKKISIIVTDPAGMHIRPASIISKKAIGYTSNIDIEYNEKKASMKSIISIMSLGIVSQSQIDIIFEGADEDIACEEILSCLKENKMIEN